MAAAAAATEEGNPAPANDQEMVLYSSDGIESFGFVEHLKLPHFVTFGSGIAVNEDPGQVAGSEETIVDEFTPIDALDREPETVTAGAPAGGSAS
jgi:hypothetical protein